MRRFLGFAASTAAAIALALPTGTARAADHGDAPNVAGDQGADLADTFFFRDPNDNSKIFLAMTLHGFITPGEAINFGVFDSRATFRFEIENTGDAKADEFIEVTFSPKGATAAEPQIASVKLPGSKKVSFTAPTTPATFGATAPAPTITTDPASGVQFFAGMVDDPFNFDIPAFNRFVASVKAGSPDPTLLSRGRDTFAGYNILTIALSFPADLIRGKDQATVIGVNSASLRRTESVGKAGLLKASGKFRQVDRAAIPAVNVALIPFARKNEFNAATAADVAKGAFSDDIVASLKSLGTNDANIDTLATVVVKTGDYLRLNLNIPNTGNGGGTNPEAAFPNGRRPSDDVIDTILTIIANGTPLTDNANVNDVPLRNSFPFFGEAHQPLDTGVTDDLTRN
jgi:hypothetical protein